MVSAPIKYFALRNSTRRPKTYPHLPALPANGRAALENISFLPAADFRSQTVLSSAPKEAALECRPKLTTYMTRRTATPHTGLQPSTLLTAR
jgi:hypothetical protein